MKTAKNSAMKPRILGVAAAVAFACGVAPLANAVPVLPGDDETTLHDRIKISEREMVVEWVGRLAREPFTIIDRTIDFGENP